MFVPRFGIKVIITFKSFKNQPTPIGNLWSLLSFFFFRLLLFFFPFFSQKNNANTGRTVYNEFLFLI